MHICWSLVGFSRVVLHGSGLHHLAVGEQISGQIWLVHQSAPNGSGLWIQVCETTSPGHAQRKFPGPYGDSRKLK